MELLHIIILALVQGLSEFLPISSSAHLVLLPILTGWDDQGLVYDVAAHIGSLIAVVFYFRLELISISQACLGSLCGRGFNDEAKLGWAVILGTIPTGLAGIFLLDHIDQLRNPTVIAVTTIVFGILLGLADHKGSDRGRSEHSIGWRDVLLIGCAQALALIPGTSRSGITITVAMFVGLSRSAAARFSFLLSIPVILAAGGKLTLTIVQQNMPIDWAGLALVILFSALSAYACIHFFLKMIARMSMMPFVIYRLLLGTFLLAFIAL